MEQQDEFQNFVQREKTAKFRADIIGTNNNCVLFGKKKIMCYHYCDENQKESFYG